MKNIPEYNFGKQLNSESKNVNDMCYKKDDKKLCWNVNRSRKSW